MPWAPFTTFFFAANAFTLAWAALTFLPFGAIFSAGAALEALDAGTSFFSSLGFSVFVDLAAWVAALVSMK